MSPAITATGMHTHEAGFILTERIMGLAIKMHRLSASACWRPSITIASAGTPARRHFIP